MQHGAVTVHPNTHPGTILAEPVPSEMVSVYTATGHTRLINAIDYPQTQAAPQDTNNSQVTQVQHITIHTQVFTTGLL